VEPYLIAGFVAGAILLVALIGWLVQKSQERQQRARLALRAPPDFETLLGTTDEPRAIDDPPGVNDTVDSEPEPEPIEHTACVEPAPVVGTRADVRQAQVRAARHIERCSQAFYQRHDLAEAETFARAALREVNLHMRRDHWYAPRVLNWLAYLRYEQGFTVEARDLWENAEQIALEWHEQCQDILPDIQRNIRAFYENF